MAHRVFSRVLALAVLEVGGLHQDLSAARPGVLAVGANVVHAHQYRVRDFTGSWGMLVPADVGDDDSAVPDAELRAMALADPEALLEPERGAEPADRLADVRVSEDGDDDSRRNRAVWLHPATVPTVGASASCTPSSVFAVTIHWGRRGLLRSGDFLRLWSGQTVSAFGSQISALALPWIAVTLLHASAFKVSALLAIEYVAFALVSLPA
jgi:hypothetical protein